MSSERKHHSYSCGDCAAEVDISKTTCPKCGMPLTPDSVIKIEIENGEAIIQLIDEDEL